MSLNAGIFYVAEKKLCGGIKLQFTIYEELPAITNTNKR